MPYCTQCGFEVTDKDVFCGRCGGRQREGGATGAPSPLSDQLKSITPQTASLLCYIPLVGWVAAIVVLAADRFRGDKVVRFHAFQGLYLFVAWLIVKSMSEWFHALRGPDFIWGIFSLAIFAAWIFMIIKTSQNEAYHLPVLGELAERSVSEER